eukprot:NODE_2284_length_607_cov_62.835417_g2234_i0.p1 GENE.NODE_2284_length_607_cov_62.835417_g2234_i0~~NODE_2284_length_607_cov_62.835417_g2234_i0.p1  ORF type:complete len:150 (+),score=12.84 NODE_2284_length_607_cov_62.835417_g2234_i0:93-542(+)
MGVTARLAELVDADSIADSIVKLALESENLALDPSVVSSGVRRLLTNPSLGFYIVAVDDGKFIGCAGITKEFSDWNNEFYWWFQSVYVVKEHRSRGVFRVLFNFVKAMASSEVHSLRLYVEKENNTAIEVYKRVGMTPSHYEVFEMSMK